MRWIRFLLILAAAVVVIAGGTLALLLTLDPNDYKPQIENFVTSQTGRTLELDGHVGLELGAITSLELADARFGNPPWASKPYMAKVARAKVSVDVRTLLQGPIVVELIELENAELHLEAGEDGSDNWTFGESDSAPPDTVKGEKANHILPLVLRHVRGQDVLFTLTLPALPRPLIIHADHAIQDELPDEHLKASISGTLNERAVSLSGTYGTLSDLVNAENLRFDVEGRLDTLSFRGKGQIDDLTGPQRPTVELNVTGPNIDDVTAAFGLPELGAGGFDLNANVQPTADAVTTEVNGKIGDNTIDVKLIATDLATWEQFSVDISVNGPDLSKILAVGGISDAPGGPFEASGKIVRDQNRIEIDNARLAIGSTELMANGTINDFVNLDDSRLKLRLNGTDIEQFRALIGIPGAAAGPFQINADLNVQPDGAELLDVYLQTNIATLRISGAIVGTSPAFLGTTLKFDGNGKDLAAFSEAYDIPNAIPAPFTIKGAIQLGDQRLSSTETVIVKVGANRASINGTMGYEPLERDTDLRIDATGPDLARIAAMANVVESVPALPFDVSAGLAVDPEGYTISDLAGTLGESKLTLDGVISKAAGFAGSRATFSATGPELSELIIDPDLPDSGKGPFDISGDVELLIDTLRLRQVQARIDDATATLDAEIGLPLESGSGRFDLDLRGSNLRAAMPIRLRWQPPKAPFEVRAKGKLADGLWSFDDLALRLADATLDGSGVFDQPPDLSRTKISINAKIPDLANLGLFDGQSLSSTRISFDMTFAGSPTSFSIDPYTAQIADGDLRGSLVAKFDGAVPDIQLQLISDVLDLSPLIAIDPEVAAATDQQEAAARAERAEPENDDGRLIPDNPLQLDLLRKLNATVDIDAKKLLFGGAVYDDVELDAQVQDGALVIERLNLNTPRGQLTGDLSLIPTATSADLKLNLDAKGVYGGLSRILTAEDIATAPSFDAKINLDGTGTTLRELAASLNGKVNINSTPGRIPNSNLTFLFGSFLSELFDSINPFAKKDPYTELSCLVVLLDIADGEVNFKPGFIAQTDKINIAAAGRANLGSEKLKIGIKTSPRSRVSISAGELINPYLEVAGTLNNPRIQIDPTGAIITGSAAVATMGISILATTAYDRIFRADDPCAAAIQEAENTEEKTKRKKFLGIF